MKHHFMLVGPPTLIDRVKVLRPARQKIGHFGDVLTCQSSGVVLKKLTRQQQTTQEQKSKMKQKNTQNAKREQTHNN